MQHGTRDVDQCGVSLRDGDVGDGRVSIVMVIWVGLDAQVSRLGSLVTFMARMEGKSK